MPIFPSEQEQNVRQEKDEREQDHIGVLTSSPGAYFFVEEELPATEESIFHPVKAIKDLIAAIKENTKQTKLVLKQLEMERQFLDVPMRLGLTIGYYADYQERKYIYAYSNQSVTLLYDQTTTKAIAANTWVNISPPRGTLITLQGGNDAALQLVRFRLCDFQLN